MPFTFETNPNTAPYTANFAPASYAGSTAATVTAQNVCNHRKTRRIWPVVPRPARSADSSTATFGSNDHKRIWPVVPRPARSADSSTATFGSNDHKRIWPVVPRPARSADSSTATFGSNDHKRIWPVVPRPASNADSSAATCGSNDGDFGDFDDFDEGEKGLEKLDQLAQHCAYIRKQVEMLVSRLEDSNGNVHQEQLTQQTSDMALQMDGRLLRLKTQQLELDIQSLKEGVKEIEEVRRRQDETARSEKVAGERGPKQSLEAERDSQIERVNRALKELEIQGNVEDDGQDDKEQLDSIKDDEPAAMMLDAARNDRREDWRRWDSVSSVSDGWDFITEYSSTARHRGEGEAQSVPPAWL